MIALNEDDLRNRIMEVNRRCFESDDSTASRLKVVRAFAKYFPDLVFDASWIKALLKREHPEHGFSKEQKEVLKAIQTGIHSAVTSKRRKSAVQKSHFISAARLMAKETIAPEISKWNESLQRDTSPLPGWIAQQVAEKADQLGRTYRLGGLKRLTQFLKRGHCKKAAVLIAAELLGVNERDIESKKD